MTWLDLVKRIAPILVLALLAVLAVNRTLAVIEDERQAIANAHQDGYEKGRKEAKAEGDAALAQLQAEFAAAAAKAARQAEADAKEAAKRLQEEQHRADGLAVELASQQRKHRTTTDRLTGEIVRVNDLYRDALDAQPKPLPTCVFTSGWVRVWDEATGAVVPQADDPDRADTPGTESRAADQLDSGLSQSQVLEHHVRYAEQCRNTAVQLDLLIDHLEGK